MRIALGTLSAAAAAVMLAGGLAQPANAALLDISGGTLTTVPVVNDVIGAAGIGTLGSSQYLIGSTLSTTASDVTLTFYDVGNESGWTDRLLTQTLSDDNDFAPGSGLHLPLPGQLVGGELQTSAGLLKLDFQCVAGDCGGGTLPVNLISNQGSFATASGASLAFAYLDPSTFQIVSEATNVVLFALDDRGAGPDDNHDDYVGIVVATPVPAALPLFLTALGGAGVWSRRRNKRVVA